MPTRMDGLDSVIQTKDWGPVTISFGWLTAMKTSKVAYFEVLDDLTANLIKEQGTNESNNGQVQRCKHDPMVKDSTLRMGPNREQSIPPQHLQCSQGRWDYQT